jgi:hypothetical protein
MSFMGGMIPTYTTYPFYYMPSIYLNEMKKIHLNFNMKIYVHNQQNRELSEYSVTK